MRVTSEQADQGVSIAVFVVPVDDEVSVVETQQTHRHSHMPPVIKEWQKRRVQAAQRTDRENDRQKDKCRRSKRTNWNIHGIRIGIEERCKPDKSGKIESDTCEQDAVADLLLAVPLYGAIGD